MSTSNNQGFYPEAWAYFARTFAAPYARGDDYANFFPPDKDAEEFRYWQAHCGCDVESWTQPETGHALYAHRSMPAFTDKVVTWLGSKGLAAN